MSVRERWMFARGDYYTSARHRRRVRERRQESEARRLMRQLGFTREQAELALRMLSARASAKASRFGRWDDDIPF